MAESERVVAVSASPRLLHRPHVFVLAALVVLVQGVLALVLACPATADDATSVAPAATAQGTPARGSEAPTPGPLAHSGALVTVAECTTHHPCQHEATEAAPAGDLAVRAPDGPRDSGPASAPICLEAADTTPPLLDRASTPGWVPASVLAPVAVLCVDRN